MFGQLLAREYGDPSYFTIHQLTVDTYAAQHPGQPERRTIQSVGLHLMTLCMVMERDFDPSNGPVMHKKIVANPPTFTWLDPPADLGKRTVKDVLAAETPEQHRDLVMRWGRAVWEAWAPHHDQVRGWIDEVLEAL
jgi:hypothetical protein